MTFDRREGKVSAPRSAYGTNQKPSYRKLDENSSKLAKRRKDVNKEGVTFLLKIQLIAPFFEEYPKLTLYRQNKQITIERPCRIRSIQRECSNLGFFKLILLLFCLV